MCFPFYRAILLEGEFNVWLSRGVPWQSISHPGVQVQALLTQMQSCAFQYLRLLDNSIEFYLRIIPLNLAHSIIIIIPIGMPYCSQRGLGKRCQLGKNKTKPTQFQVLFLVGGAIPFIFSKSTWRSEKEC